MPELFGLGGSSGCGTLGLRMSVIPKNIGAYEVLREIGRGGMGVVYLGRDGKLERDVAIKVVPEDLAGDEERLARFEREARALASVSHPNIAGIYAVEEHEGRRYLVLEYVEGQTLDDRLDGGPLPVDDAVEIGAQIAAGVEAAHEAGVVHRDLKPGNVMITTEGAVKVLDFGLARTTEASSASSVAEQPTVESPRSPTIPGAILGTAPYMSPEQARGRKVDQRSDVWSFGVILYECLAGASPFVGETVSDSIGAILHADPDWSRLPAETPPTVQLLLRRCLQRDRKRRLQNVGDARIELEAAIEDPTSGSMLLAGPLPGRRGRRVPVTAALVAVPVLLAVGAVAGWLGRPATAPPRAVHLAVPIPESFDAVGDMGLSPDGRTLAVVAGSRDWADRPIHLRDLGMDGLRELAGTEGATSVRFSPSGRRIFFRRAEPTRPVSDVRSVPVTGGPVLTAYRAEQIGLLSSRRFAPLSDDEVLAISQDGQELYRVRVPEGEPRRIAAFDWPEGDLASAVSVPREGGRFAVVTRWSTDPSTGARGPSLVRVDLETGQTMALVDDGGGARFVEPGGLVFERSDNFFYAPFDLDRAEMTGPPRACLTEATQVRISRAGGHLVYRPRQSGADQAMLAAVDASGRAEPLMASRGDFSSPRVSPNGRRLAYVASSPGDELARVWVLDLGSGLARPVTPKGEAASRPGWMPDGRIAYSRYGGPQHREILLVEPTGGAVPEPMLPEPDGRGDQSGPVFSPDGQHVIFSYMSYDGREPGLYTMRLGDPESVRPFFATPVIEGMAEFSRDGKWVAYHTNGSGRFEVYLRPFDPVNPEATPIHRVSTDGGLQPIWSRDGATLYYLTGLEFDELVAASVETEPEPSISEPRRLFKHPDLSSSLYDTLPGEDRFVTVTTPEGEGERRNEIRIVLNWLAGLGD